MSPSVRVSVLSRQMTSTRASPSTAGSSLTSTCREARGADGEGDGCHEHEPERDHRRHRRDRRGQRVDPRAGPPRLPPPAEDLHLGVEDEEPHGTDRPAHPAEHAVDRVAELRPDEREPLRLAGERVGVGIRAHADHLRVGGQLVARAQDEDVSEHDVAGRDLGLRPVATHTRRRGVQQGQLVEGGLRSELLQRADERVADRGEAEQGVLSAADDEQHAEAGEDDPVEQREDVRADDAPRAAARLGPIRVALPRGGAAPVSPMAGSTGASRLGISPSSPPRGGRARRSAAAGRTRSAARGSR